MTIEFKEMSPTCIGIYQCGNSTIATIYKWRENVEIDFEADRDYDCASILNIEDMELILNKMKELKCGDNS